ncbi:hypothetical protein C1645_812347 [Glomus cerebriforme]|uniref:Uncharacterized protein n=1 Tax=Glomus cerebriforme TaxID=658196 RepID=A0A397TMN2_9GLOM|nr:hypothetical protein C1645_812347 [Glomus cerebriforme]
MEDGIDNLTDDSLTLLEIFNSQLIERALIKVQIIKEKGDTVFSNEKSEIATAFYEELKFCYDQTEQVFRNMFLTLRVYDQYWRRLATEYYRKEGNLYQLQHRANAEKRDMEFDTKIGQNLVDNDIEDESKNESKNDNDYDETGNESDKRFYSYFNYDTTDDEFDERFISLF